MAKKKRVGRKPASAATEIVDQDPDLPSIQEEATDPELAEDGMMPVVKENARRQEQDKTQANKDWVTPKRKAQLVMDCWNKEIAGNGLDKIMRKLFRVKHALKAFQRAEVGDVRKDYKEAKETFCNIQEAAANFPNDVFIQQVNLDEAILQQAARGDKFSAKKCYNSLVGETPFAYANAIWDTLVLPKHRFIFWQIANSHLLTRDYLHHIMVTPNNLCPVCEVEVETHDHIFFNCYYTSQVFEAVNRWLGDIHWPRSTAEMLQLCNNATKDLTQRILNAVMAAVFYFLWKNRNKCVFDYSCMVPSKLSLEVRKIVQLRVVCKYSNQVESNRF
ncbi:hypothetical protein G4B88_008033 [Cannabis sativa]|uniref:Reverse transcriptase zinc-binding domain-containing protein n=1 Tax=Cannabis sativa TaxID=3483 RepID=A0A7J6I752_CANSA|nr:hypothetical protein G4B88_008033 [Cannabis sativa]